MRAMLIDPKAVPHIVEVDWDGTLQEIYRLLDVEIIDAVRIGDNAGAIYVDDEGLLKCREELERRGFFFGPQGQPLAGRGLLVGPVDEDGNDTECKLSLNMVREYLIPWPEQDVPALLDKIERIYG